MIAKPSPNADQSFTASTLHAMLRGSDFHIHKWLKDDSLREQMLASAAELARSGFTHDSPLESISVRGRNVYRPRDLQRTLIIRKLFHNFRVTQKVGQPGRRHILRNVNSLLTEGVPYRVYKADVRRFYDSFPAHGVRHCIDNATVSARTKHLTHALLHHYWAAGAAGLPLGLNISSVLSELLMARFDQCMRTARHVHFYVRYVDDILLLTSGVEHLLSFQQYMEASLPQGLQLGRAKSYQRSSLHPKTSAFDLNFLGYRFTVHTGNAKSLECSGRTVSADLSAGKLQKVKTRIARSFISFAKSKNFDLLEKRVRFLTSNVSLPQSGSAVRQLIGLATMYPDVTSATGLEELDRFLRRSILASKGRTFDQYVLSKDRRNRLLAYSFVRGHSTKHFFHFSHTTLEQIQRCWSLED